MIAGTVRIQRGFTLLEVMLVLALMVILGSLAYFSLDGMAADQRVAAGADAFRACMAEARSRALEEGRSYRCSVVPGKGNYRAAPDSPDYWTGSDDPVSTDNSSSPPYIKSDVLPKGVAFYTPDNPPGDGPAQGTDSSLPPDQVPSSSWTTMVTFAADGTTRDDVSLILQGRGARPLALKLRALTGVVTVQPYQPDGNNRP